MNYTYTYTVQLIDVLLEIEIFVPIVFFIDGWGFVKTRSGPVLEIFELLDPLSSQFFCKISALYCYLIYEMQAFAVSYFTSNVTISAMKPMSFFSSKCFGRYSFHQINSLKKTPLLIMCKISRSWHMWHANLNLQ